MHLLRDGHHKVKVPSVKEFVARKTQTIPSGKAQGTYWNRIKCKECCGNPPEAVIGQATINLDSWVWKSLEDSLPKLYCVDLAEAYVMQESMSLRLMCKKREVWYAIAQQTFAPETFGEEQKRDTNLVLSHLPGSHKCLSLRKQHDLCQKYGVAHRTYYFGVPKVWENGTRNWITVQPSKAQRN